MQMNKLQMTYMNLRKLMFSEGGQKPKNTLCIILFIQSRKTRISPMVLEARMVVTSGEGGRKCIDWKGLEGSLLGDLVF